MAVIGHSDPVQTEQSTSFGSVTINPMRWSMIVFLGFFTACAPDEPNAVDSQGWRKIQEFGPAVQVPRDGALRLEYGVTGGAAVFDADGDGDLDILLTGTSPKSPTRLWRQTTNLEFVDASEGSGFDATFFGIGATAGDVDGDGDVDVLMTGRLGCQLYRNNGVGIFEQSTDFLAPKCSSSATFVDYDLDGDLDLFVCRYADISLNPDKECRDPAGRLELCGPTAHPALHDLLLNNDGNGTFTDVSVNHGLDRVAAAGLGVVVDDFTGDDLLDLYVANDGYENHLWVMGEDGLFTEQAAQRGLALNLMGETEAGMGVVSLDVDGDMAPDLYCTHLAAESNTLYIGKNNAFLDSTAPLGLGVASMPRTGFGVVARDFNRDGREDLLVGNGRVTRGSSVVLPSLDDPWNGMAEPNDLYLRSGRGFELAPKDPVLSEVGLTRAVVAGDFDRQGQLEVLIVNVETPSILVTPPKTQARELFVEAVDQAGHPVLHALILCQSGDKIQRRRQGISDGYASAQPPEVHFGLGASQLPAELTVRWPDGSQDAFQVEPHITRFQAQKGSGR
ncbi:MAG TPA: hypothetical protein DEQ73_05580 [Phycisphaerales bacterium]|nr:hypothetical protein [Phycisphaerales bacterium]